MAGFRSWVLIRFPFPPWISFWYLTIALEGAKGLNSDQNNEAQYRRGIKHLGVLIVLMKHDILISILIWIVGKDDAFLGHHQVHTAKEYTELRTETRRQARRCLCLLVIAKFGS